MIIDKNSHRLDRDLFPRSNDCRACSDPPDYGYFHYTDSDTPLEPVGCIGVAFRTPRPGLGPAFEASRWTPRIEVSDRSAPSQLDHGYQPAQPSPGSRRRQALIRVFGG